VALVAARQGKRTLACEFDAKGNLADFFSAAPTGWDPTEVQPNLFAMSMDTEESLKEYLRLQVKIPLIGGKVADWVAKNDVQQTLDAEFAYNDKRLSGS